MQLFAVYAVMEAFDLDLPLPAAGLVLLLMNVATIFPFWPGNIGLLQAAVALPLVQYGVPYGTGFAYALVLQAVEMSVGVGVGLVFLAREGLSLASLQTMEEEQESEEDAIVRDRRAGSSTASERSGRLSTRAQSLTIAGVERAEAGRDHLVGGGSCRLVARHRGDELVPLEGEQDDVGRRGHRRRPRHVAEQARSRRNRRPRPSRRPATSTSPSAIT